METIQAYLDTMFARIEETPEVARVRIELLANMEEKYHELRAQGLSENESIGAVISEFGQVDELFAELGVPGYGAAAGADEGAGTGTGAAAAATTDPEAGLPLLLSKKADAYLDTLRQSANGIANGVALILFGVSALLFSAVITAPTFSQFEWWYGLSPITAILSDSVGLNVYLPLALFFCFLVPAIALIVMAGLRMQGYENLACGRFRLDAGTRERLTLAADGERQTFNRGVVSGVVLILVGVLVVFMLSMLLNLMMIASPAMMFFAALRTAILPIFIGVAVRRFIRVGIVRSAYNKLLKRGDYLPANKRADKIIAAVAALVWPLTVAVYLVWSFTTDSWDRSWIIWPVVAMVFGGFAGVTQMLLQEDED
ncbi:MAG: permease prefix domain 1-containing protein [Actinomycetes bacterium]|nr:permease prefix domain 1-containing protein [Actinomycetes bacterium]